MKNTYALKIASVRSTGTKVLLPLMMIVALFLLAACGGGTTGGNGGSTPTATSGSGATATSTTSGSTGSGPCSLVTTAQVEQVLGGTVQSKPQTTTVGTTKADGCAYTSSQGTAASIGVVSSADATTAKTAFTQLQQATKVTAGSKYQDVSGLGDGAYTDGNILYVLKGKSIVVFTVTESDATKALDAEKQLAQDALPNVA